MKKTTTFFISTALLGLVLTACNSKPKAEEPTAKETTETAKSSVESRHPEWVKNANIYEVNIRQYSPEGTINAFVEHLPRLQKMGVDILWIMPVQPIGLEKRKESEDDLGSFYSIKDYRAVNPDLGTLEDFKNMVNEAHQLGMHVVLDWVANHTAWDHHWVTENPDWYTSDSAGNRPIVPIDNEGNPTDWTDVADLNYKNMEMRAAMTESMKFWLNETNLDGFRCDVAGFVPNAFWKDAIAQLRDINPQLFMLAEWEDPSHMEFFNMNYGWHLHHIMNQIAKGEEPVSAFADYAKLQDSLYTSDDLRMFFITNHDENSWNGTVRERMGESGLTHFVLALTYEKGMPLIYSGQEAGLDKRLSFFGKDSIDWSNDSLISFYTRALALKHKNPALWNGNYGGEMTLIETNNSEVFAYKRTKGENEVVVFLNFSDQPQPFDNHLDSQFTNWFSGENENLGNQNQLPGFGYKIFVKNPIK